MKNILVAGSVNMDLVIKTPRLPKLGETIEGSDFETVPGGKGVNQAVAVAKLGGNVKIIGMRGSDVFGNVSENNLINCGVGTEGLNNCDASTGIAVITVCGGDNFIILDKGANKYLNEEIIEKNRHLFEWADILVMQLEIPMKTVVYAAKIAHENNCSVLLNPAPAQRLPAELYKYTDIIVLNEHEASQISEISDINDYEKCIDILTERGIPQVIVTLGEKGSVFNFNGKKAKVPAFKVNAVDTTAAGDSFIGGLAVGLCEGKNIFECVEYATAVSAITVSRYGASVSIPDSMEVGHFLNNI